MSNEPISFTVTQQLNNELVSLTVGQNFNIKRNNHRHKHNHCWFEGKQNNVTEYCVPLNFVPGVAKCGTTFLYSTLILHPQITSSVIKELNYFSSGIKKHNLAYYSNEFIDKNKQIEQNNKQVIHNKNKHELQPVYEDALDYLRIDISPHYFPNFSVPRLIVDRIPEAKFLLLFRDPVERTFSHFNYFLLSKENFEDCNYTAITFERFLNDEYQWLSKCNKINWLHPSVYFIIRILIIMHLLLCTY